MVWTFFFTLPRFSRWRCCQWAHARFVSSPKASLMQNFTQQLYVLCFASVDGGKWRAMAVWAP